MFRRLRGQRGLQLIFLANVVSMVGSGMNSAALTWYVLKTTGSAEALGTLVVLSGVPALVLLPFSGVIIDREDRRRLIMLLDGIRAAVIGVVAVLALRGEVQIWHLYAMNMIVAAVFWIFWPTIAALIQELTPESEFVHSNTLLLAGVQGGWLLAGAVVGFLYDRIGLGGVLLLDFCTYLLSLTLYFFVPKGRVLVKPRQPDHLAPAGAAARFFHELKEGARFLRGNPGMMLLGLSWALWVGAMLTQGVITAPLSDRILHAGAIGYGWLNGGWGLGAFLSAIYAPVIIAALRKQRATVMAMLVMGTGLVIIPHLPWLAVAVLIYGVMGSARAVAGVAMNSRMMEEVPPHIFGRVQNTFYFASAVLQLGMSYGVAWLAHHMSLTAAFTAVGVSYFLAAAAMALPHGVPRSEPELPGV